MSGTRVVSYMEENKIGSLAYIEKINSKWIQYLNIDIKT
jgi:hypothetical protein